MEVETAFLGSESDNDELLYEELRQEEYAERLRLDDMFSSIESSSTTTSSSSSSSSDEEEPEECYESRRFIERLSMNPCVSSYELGHLVTAPNTTKRAPKQQVSETQLVVAKGENRITEEDRKRRVIHIHVNGTSLDVMIENYVYVSYFCNRHTGAKYRLGLCETATKMLPYGVSFSKSKFTKVTHKNLDASSHYLFGSGVCVESGTYSDAIAYKTHYNTMCILRDTCGYESIAVKKRKCQNIVAKGTLKFGLCLLLLKHKYPNYVEYNDEKFKGAIIRVNKIDADLNDSRSRHQYDDDDDDSYPSSSSSSSNSDSENSSSDSYEYFEESPYAKKTCHEEFDYKVLDKKIRRENEALLQQKEDECDYSVLDKKPVKHRDLLQLHNPDELNDDQVKTLTQKKNVTVLAFPKGRIICAGGKSDKEVLKTFIKVTAMLVSCEANDANKIIEAELLLRLLSGQV